MTSPSFNLKVPYRRLMRDISAVILLLLALELLLRIPALGDPVAAKLSEYELLLRYDTYLPAYERALKQEQVNAHDLWLLGSSYMMTSLNPALVEASLHAQGFEDIHIQNYGLTDLRDLEVMGQVIERNLLSLAQPQYVLIGVAVPNFREQAAADTPILQSPYERAMILPQSIDEHLTGFLYRNSHLYRSTILLRNFLSNYRSHIATPVLPLGGYTPRTRVMDCAATPELSMQGPPDNLGLSAGLQRLDTLIDRLLAQDIQVLVLNIPLPACMLYDAASFGNFANYEASYLQPLARHLADRDIPFHALDARFYAEIPPNQQGRYYTDLTHTNIEGAALISDWAAEPIADWLASQP